MPAVTVEQITTYLDLFSQDLRASSKGMYKGKFLRSIRLATDRSFSFICGRVSAEMFKKVVYKVDVRIDHLGVIDQCQCECASGMGPEAHCKHVGLVLHSLTKVKEGIITAETCTQVLQTFHQAKKYTGSPVKMENILLRSSSSHMSALKGFDPRPLHHRNRVEYPDHFRSVWLNSTATNPPIRQLYCPANVYGIANDHQYMSSSPEDMFLEGIHVKNMSSNDREQVEKKTRGQAGNKMWKEERLLRLQASSFGRICKATEKTNFENLAKSLTEHKYINSESLKHGRKYEATAQKEYVSQTKVTVIQSGIIVCEQLPFLGCSPDGLVAEDQIIEIKCPYTARANNITPISVPYLYCDSNGDIRLKENHEYYYQIMGNLLCTGRTSCDFIVWTFKEMKILRIKRDESFINKMKDQLNDFFTIFFRPALLNKMYYRGSHEF